MKQFRIKTQSISCIAPCNAIPTSNPDSASAPSSANKAAMSIMLTSMARVCRASANRKPDFMPYRSGSTTGQDQQ